MTMAPAPPAQSRDTLIAAAARLRAEVQRSIVGQERVLDEILMSLIAGGHALLVGVPGLAKTLMVRSLAEAVHLEFRRIQFTPDLVPSDITGTDILEEDSATGARSFRYVRGPIFANIVLADEINRATPRTQAAFLEAMQERHVTVFGVTHRLDEPFSVFATQNPIEMEGTYPLPEAQLDRFFFKLTVQVPGIDDLVEIMSRTTGERETAVSARFGRVLVTDAFAMIRQVKIADPVLRYALRLVGATHSDAPDAPETVRKYVRYGASPRAAQAMVLAAKGLALLSGRWHASVNDLRHVAQPALCHRLIRNFQAEMDRVSADMIVQDVLNAVREP